MAPPPLWREIKAGASGPGFFTYPAYLLNADTWPLSAIDVKKKQGIFALLQSSKTII
jgi:hypothetical protein